MYDSCSCENSEECMCAAVSAYVYACSAAGVHIHNWRSTTCGKLFKHLWCSCEDTVAHFSLQSSVLTLLAYIWCRHSHHVFQQAATLTVRPIPSIATTWPPVAVPAALSVRLTTLARSASVRWMVVVVRKEPTWMTLGFVCSRKSVPAMIKTLSLMPERPTPKTAPHGKCVNDYWLHVNHHFLIVLMLIPVSYYYY